MNQIFHITVGQDTLQGRLPTFRVGKGYCSRFEIAGVAHIADVPAPKVWVTLASKETKFWTGVWSADLGLWIVEVNSEPSGTVGSLAYAVTMFGEVADKEYIAGQGTLTVYDSVASGSGETGGATGDSVGARLIALEGRVAAIENKFDVFATLATFDPQTAFDIDLRSQVQIITNILRGGE